VYRVPVLCVALQCDDLCCVELRLLTAVGVERDLVPRGDERDDGYSTKTFIGCTTSSLLNGLVSSKSQGRPSGMPHYTQIGCIDISANYIMRGL
jgi:hypothetical protein